MWTTVGHWSRLRVGFSTLRYHSFLLIGPMSSKCQKYECCNSISCICIFILGKFHLCYWQKQHIFLLDKSMNRKQCFFITSKLWKYLYVLENKLKCTRSYILRRLRSSRKPFPRKSCLSWKTHSRAFPISYPGNRSW